MRMSKKDKVKTPVVTSTNDSSTLSKISMVRLGYFDDVYLDAFIPTRVRRSPIINRGYFVRVWAVHEIVLSFIKANPGPKQIISLGAGFDTLYLRLKKERLIDSDTKFYEIDFEAVINRKRSFVKNFTDELNFDLDVEYFLIANDLRRFDECKQDLENRGFSTQMPTLLLAECVLNYLDSSHSNTILDYFAQNVSQCVAVLYEQIKPDDGFGKFMISHFDNIGSTLKSIRKYTSLCDEYERFSRMGWSEVNICDMNYVYYTILSPWERERVARLEPFDEVEPWHLKCSHYALSVLHGNGEILGMNCPFVGISPPKKSHMVLKSCIVEFPEYDVAFRRYGHACVEMGESKIIIGGFGEKVASQMTTSGHSRCDDVIHLAMRKKTQTICNSTELERMYHSAVRLPSNEIFVFGGRKSPVSFPKSLALVLTDIGSDSCKVTPQTITCQTGEVESRWRHASCFIESRKQIFICGGITKNSQVTPETLLIGEDYQIKQVATLPDPLHSHSVAYDSLNDVMYITGGLKEIDNDVNEVIFKYDLSTETYIVIASLIPERYSHNSHVINDHLIIVGGVNNDVKSYSIPDVTLFNVKTFTTRNVSIPNSIARPLMLVGHVSFVTKSDDQITVSIFGGGGNCFSFGTLFNPVTKIMIDV